MNTRKVLVGIGAIIISFAVGINLIVIFILGKMKKLPIISNTAFISSVVITFFGWIFYNSDYNTILGIILSIPVLFSIIFCGFSFYVLLIPEELSQMQRVHNSIPSNEQNTITQPTSNTEQKSHHRNPQTMNKKKIFALLGAIFVTLAVILGTMILAATKQIKKKTIFTPYFILICLSIIVVIVLLPLLPYDMGMTMLILEGILLQTYTGISFYKLMSEEQDSQGGSPSSKEDQRSSDNTSKVKINQVFEDEIAKLPLVTLIDARKIVDERIKNGNYTDFDDFTRRTHLAESTLRQINNSLDFSLSTQETKQNKTVNTRKIEF